MIRFCSIFAAVFLFAAAAWAQPVNTHAIEGSLSVLPSMTWLPDPHNTMDYTAAASPKAQSGYLPLTDGFPVKATGPGWLRLELAKSEQQSSTAPSRIDRKSLYLNLSFLPSGKATLYRTGSFSPQTASGHQPLAARVYPFQTERLAEPSIGNAVYYLHLEETPGLWFNPTLSRTDSKSPILPHDLLLPSILLACLAFSLLRLAIDRTIWPVWAAAILVCVICGLLLPVPIATKALTYKDLPVLLAPGIAVMIYAHLGRLLLYSPATFPKGDTLLRFYPIVGAVAALAPLLPDGYWLTRLFPLWGLLLIPLLIVSASALVRQLKGSFAYFVATFMPVLGAAIAIYGVYNPGLNMLSKTGTFWGVAIGSFALIFARSASPVKKKPEKTEARKEPDSATPLDVFDSLAQKTAPGTDAFMTGSLTVPQTAHQAVPQTAHQTVPQTAHQTVPQTVPQAVSQTDSLAAPLSAPLMPGIPGTPESPGTMTRPGFPGMLGTPYSPESPVHKGPALGDILPLTMGGESDDIFSSLQYVNLSGESRQEKQGDKSRHKNDESHTSGKATQDLPSDKEASQVSAHKQERISNEKTHGGYSLNDDNDGNKNNDDDILELRTIAEPGHTEKAASQTPPSLEWPASDELLPLSSRPIDIFAADADKPDKDTLLVLSSQGSSLSAPATELSISLINKGGGGSSYDASPENEKEPEQTQAEQTQVNHTQPDLTQAIQEQTSQAQASQVQSDQTQNSLIIPDLPPLHPADLPANGMDWAEFDTVAPRTAELPPPHSGEPESDTPTSNITQPGIMRPDTIQPGSAQPSTIESGTAKAATIAADMAEQKKAQPETDNGTDNTAAPALHIPKLDIPGLDTRPDTAKPDMEASYTTTPDTAERDTGKRDTVEQDTGKPETTRLELSDRQEEASEQSDPEETLSVQPHETPAVIRLSDESLEAEIPPSAAEKVDAVLASLDIIETSSDTVEYIELTDNAEETAGTEAIAGTGEMTMSSIIPGTISSPEKAGQEALDRAYIEALLTPKDKHAPATVEEPILSTAESHYLQHHSEEERTLLESYGNRCIIITEMTTSNKRLLRSYFNEIGIPCVEAHGIDDTITLQTKTGSPLVIYDADSPADTIVESIKRLNSAEKQPNHLVLASVESQGQHLEEQGATLTISKPFTKESLFEAAYKTAPALFGPSQPDATTHPDHTATTPPLTLPAFPADEKGAHAALATDSYARDLLDGPQFARSAEPRKNASATVAATPDMMNERRVDDLLAQLNNGNVANEPPRQTAVEQTASVISKVLSVEPEQASPTTPATPPPTVSAHEDPALKVPSRELLKESSKESPKTKDSLLDFIVTEDESEPASPPTHSTATGTSLADATMTDATITEPATANFSIAPTITATTTADSAGAGDIPTATESVIEEAIAPIPDISGSANTSDSAETSSAPHTAGMSASKETVTAETDATAPVEGVQPLTDFEGEYIEQLMLPLIPGLLYTLKDGLRDAQLALAEHHLFSVQEAVSNIASRADTFGLKKLDKIAQCVIRATSADDLEATTALMEDLANITKRYINSLETCYDEYITSSRPK